MIHSQGLSRGRYVRLIALSATEILGTIPFGTYFIVTNAKIGVQPWKSWADTHSNYSKVIQVPSIVWENDPNLAGGLEIFRWSLVACAVIFFAFFGFADEARQHYRLVYTFIASSIGYSTFATPSVPCGVKSGVTVTVVRTTRDKRISSVFTDQSSTPSVSIASEITPDFKIEQYTPSNSVARSSVESFDTLEMQGQPALPAGVMPTVPPASVPPHFPGRIESTMRAYSGVDRV
ncbi:pheromone A receptor-domain-containing protein [Russula ochroleuca]|uniref:Pheromone A receptor-domain-containing protein n=1 Tax=Russula ochroleuca TaxID=152965 RepID=A0A9P5JY48_9AGAM|nr:pheromone A receptor-domain-containing protein [Russula ochroleuca]